MQVGLDLAAAVVDSTGIQRLTERSESELRFSPECYLSPLIPKLLRGHSLRVHEREGHDFPYPAVEDIPLVPTDLV